jgi:glycerol kinase
MNTAQQPVQSAGGLLTMLAWQRGDAVTYALDGGVLTVGATLNWLHQTVKLIPSPEAIDKMCADMDSTPVVWIPAQTGLGAPYWQRQLRAAWLNIGLDTRPADMVFALLEGIALRVVQIVRLMAQDSGQPITALSVDGGLTHCQTLMQLQADLLGCPVQVLADAEATTRGMCYLAARQAGLWLDDAQISDQLRYAQAFEPRLSVDERESRLARFDQAVRRVGDLD